MASAIRAADMQHGRRTKNESRRAPKSLALCFGWQSCCAQSCDNQHTGCLDTPHSAQHGMARSAWEPWSCEDNGRFKGAPSVASSKRKAGYGGRLASPSLLPRLDSLDASGSAVWAVYVAISLELRSWEPDGPVHLHTPSPSVVSLFFFFWFGTEESARAFRPWTRTDTLSHPLVLVVCGLSSCARYEHGSESQSVRSRPEHATLLRISGHRVSDRMAAAAELRLRKECGVRKGLCESDC